MTTQAIAKGELRVVGLGMMLGGHITPRARQMIESADVVFVSASDAMVELWVRDMHSDVRSLQPLYCEGKSRHQTYREMVETMLAEVRRGRRVCGAFYGHPGVLAWAPHEAIRIARSEGFRASMEAGISATDCMYADLGVDPGTTGCQYYEATQLLLHDIVINPAALLVIWQAAIAGDRSFTRFSTGSAHRQLLVEELLKTYPAGHRLALYEAATLGSQPPRMDWVALGNLGNVAIDLRTTLVLPPLDVPTLRRDMLERLAAIESEGA